MMEYIPTYIVSWDENNIPDLRGNARVRLRVPRTELNAVVDALIFNDVKWFDVRLDEGRD